MSNNQPGLLLAFDGVDSSGKETQTARLADRLRHVGFAVRCFETPDYTTPSGADLKERLQNKDRAWQQLPWEDKMRLFAANRQEHKAEVLQSLRQGEIVIYDRYVASSLAFITIEALEPATIDLFRSDVQHAIARHEYEERGMPREDVSIFLDVPPDVSAALLEGRKHRRRDSDEYTDHIAVQRRLYNEYDLLCKGDPATYWRVPCVVEERLLSIEDVAEIVWEGLKAKFPLLR